MTRFWLIMLRIICILQTLIAIVRCLTSLFGLLMGGGFMLLLQAIAFGFIAALSILTIAIYNNNYPDKPVDGRQKKYFNRIFLINFLLIAFLFGFVFRDYQDAILQSGSMDSVSEPLIFLSLLLYPVVYLFFISAFYMVFIGCAGKYIIMLATSNLILRIRMFSLDFQSYPAHDPVKMEVL